MIGCEYMNDIGNKIKLLREEFSWTKRELANRLNVHESSISKYEKNLVDLPLSKIKSLSVIFNVSEAYLMGWSDKKELNPVPKSNGFKLSDIKEIINTKKIPLLGSICAGNGLFAEENLNRFVVVDTESIKADYALTVSGDSMVEANILDGDIAFFKKDFVFESGQIYAVVIKGENVGSIKKVHQKEDKLILEACNKNYSPDIYGVEDVHICGKYKGLLREN